MLEELHQVKSAKNKMNGHCVQELGRAFDGLDEKDKTIKALKDQIVDLQDIIGSMHADEIALRQSYETKVHEVQSQYNAVQSQYDKFCSKAKENYDRHTMEQKESKKMLEIAASEKAKLECLIYTLLPEGHHFEEATSGIFPDELSEMDKLKSECAQRLMTLSQELVDLKDQHNKAMLQLGNKDDTIDLLNEFIKKKECSEQILREDILARDRTQSLTIGKHVEVVESPNVDTDMDSYDKDAEEALCHHTPCNSSKFTATPEICLTRESDEILAPGSDADKSVGHEIM